jgi:putative membrane protein
MLRIVLAVLHLFALGFGMASIEARARAARRLESPNALRDVFIADSWWGFSALLWVSTGLWRWLGATEKATTYYTTNHVFLAKMGFLAVILALELSPMVTLIRWRIGHRRAALPPLQILARKGRRIAQISLMQELLVMAMVAAAVLMARGYGAN